MIVVVIALNVFTTDCFFFLLFFCYYNAVTSNHHRQQQQADGYQVEGPEATSSLSNNQRLRKSTTASSLGASDGGERRPLLRADLIRGQPKTVKQQTQLHDVVDVTTKTADVRQNSPEKPRQPFVTASGSGRDGGDDPAATASVTGVHLPIPVHHKPVVG